MKMSEIEIIIAYHFSKSNMNLQEHFILLNFTLATQLIF